MEIVEYGNPISLETAKQVIDAATSEAQSNNWAMTIAVFDSTCHIVALYRMDHARYGSVEIAQAKAKTAVNYKCPTKVYDEAVTKGGPGIRLLSIHDICPIEGGIPLIKEGKIVGAIGVSGAQSDQDCKVAIAGASIVNG